jgi:hypothetical protein
MPDVELAPGDAAELSELLTFLADWIASTDAGTLADSLTRFVASPGYDLTTLHADLHRFAFLLGATDGNDLFGHHQ